MPNRSTFIWPAQLLCCRPNTTPILGLRLVAGFQAVPRFLGCFKLSTVSMIGIKLASMLMDFVDVRLPSSFSHKFEQHFNRQSVFGFAMDQVS